jgi:PTH1 family peptidyl-tRNA hydrolase
MNLIVGLGNPGEKYNKTRHNIGFVVVDTLALKNNLTWQESKKFKALMAEGANFILVKPQTYMNKSGEAVMKILNYYKLLPRTIFGLKKNSDLSDNLIVIHDELDLPLGKYKLSVNSSSAGHNGVQSIIDYLKTQNFKRLRIGISSQLRNKIPAENFVLQKFSDEEKNLFKKILPDLIKGLN